MKHSDYLKKKKTRETRKKIISVISAIVVFITTYALVLPAITLDVSRASREPGIAFEQMQFKATASAASVTAADSTVEEVQVEEPAAEEAAEEEIIKEEAAEIPEEETSAVSDENEKEEAEQVVEEAPAESAREEAPAAEAEEVQEEEDKSAEEKADAEPSSEPAQEEAQTAEAQKSADRAAVDRSGKSGTQATEAAAAASTEETAAEFQIPTLDSIDFDEILTGKTDFYFYHVEKTEEDENITSDSVDDWKKVGSDTVLAPEDFVRVYLSYEIPAGSLNETNAEARYRLPAGLELSDKQIKDINKYENGIAASKSGREHDKYLGAEAIEGSRTPNEKAGDEYISATVKAEKVYKDGEYVGQDLIFTFIPYTVEKNQISYDEAGKLTSEGRNVKGFFTFDLTTAQIDFEKTEKETVEKEDGTKEEIQYSRAEVVFVKENNKKNIDEISRILTMAGPSEKEEPQVQEPKTLISKGEGNDYTVTVSYTDDAQIPDNAELAVREIEKDTDEYASYLEQAKGAVDENKSVNEARFFDITIVADGEKIEPQAPVNVQITFTGIEQTNTDDTQLLHYKDDKEVEVMDQAEFSKSEEPENETKAVDTVQFETDGFSVYGIVGTETISEQYIDIHGDTYKVTVTYSEDAKIPKDAKLSVTEILEGSAEYQEFYSKAAEAVLDGQEKAVPFARFFDISIMDGEEEIQPQAPVNVKIEFIGNVETQSGARFNAVHFAENSIDVMDASVQLAAEENHAVEAVSFEAEGFSVYGVTYTVDFTYKNYTFSIPGESSILLSELFEILGIEADVAEVTSVEFTDDDLIRIEQLESDWLLTSLMPFDTDELLTVTTRSGIVYRIDVQDDQDVTFPASIKASGGTYYKQGEVQTVTAQYVLTGQGQTQILNTLGLYNTPINTDEIYCTLYYQAYKHSSYNEVIYLLEIRPLDEVLIGTGYSIDNSSLWDIYTPSGNNDIDTSTARYPQTGNPAIAQNTKTIAYLRNNSYTHRRALALVFSRPVSGQYNYQLFGSGSSGLVGYKVIEVTYTDGDANGQAFTPDQVYSQRSQINGSTGAWSSVNMPAFVAADGTNTPSWTDHTFTGWKVTASEDENIPVGTVYSAADLPATVHNNVTFEAQWSSHSDKKVTVSKIVEPGTGVTADEIDQTIYIALYDQSSDSYLADGDGNIIYKEIVITDGVPAPVSVEFDGLSATRYSVREFVEVDGEKVNALHSTFVADGNLIELSGITGYNTDEGGNRITDSDNDADMANADNAWVVFENTYTTEDEPRTLTVSKRWMKNGADITDSITEATATFTLYRSIPDGEDTAVKSVTLDGSVDEPEEGVTDGEFTAWTATFSDYPARDDSGNKYTYKVRETACTPEDYLPYTNPDSESPMTEEEYKADQGTIYNKYQKTSITVKKEDDKNNFIPGAVFELYQVVTDDSDASHDVLIQELTVNEEAGYSIPNLISGDYKLREKSAPGGYVIIDSPIEFHVDAIGNSVITWPDGTKPDNVKNLTTTNVQNDTFTVINKEGHELPSTGGSGTLPYTLGGIALIMASALMYGFRMRRRERRLN